MDLPFNIFDTLPRECWTDINTRQLAENVRILIKHVDRPILVAVKANGYGHGYENAARAFVAGGAACLGVVTVSEGLLLRRMGIEAPILIIGGLLPHEMKYAVEAKLDFFVWRADHITALRELANTHSDIHAHIKIDTGMGRGGCFPAEALGVAEALRAIRGVEITGLCTHLASADVVGVDDTDIQLKKFAEVVATFANAGIRPAYYPRGELARRPLFPA